MTSLTARLASEPKGCAIHDGTMMRLSPLLAALVKVAVASEAHVQDRGDCYHEARCDDMVEALAELKAVAGG